MCSCIPLLGSRLCWALLLPVRMLRPQGGPTAPLLTLSPPWQASSSYCANMPLVATPSMTTAQFLEGVKARRPGFPRELPCSAALLCCRALLPSCCPIWLVV